MPSGSYCSVFGCNSSAKRNENVYFHRLPKPDIMVPYKNKFGQIEKINRRKAWILKLKIGKPVTRGMTVCSKHFTPGDYLPTAKGQKRHYLKKNAVPSQNLPVASHESQPTTRPPTTRKKIVENITTTGNSLLSEEPIQCKNSSPVYELPKYNNEELEAANTLLTLQNCSSKINVSTQTYGEGRKTLLDDIKTDEKLNSLTGLQSFQLLDAIQSAVEMYYEERRVKRLSLRERIVLVFMKLKTNLSYSVLGLLFDNISCRTCQLTFDEVLNIMYNVLKPTIYLPTKEEISRNTPSCFDRFKNVRLIFDCTEIPVERTKCLCCRIKCYSHYKSRNTLKFMVGVTPAGLIAFVSQVYGGRASDKAIFEQSNILEKLTPYEDEIMVDKGFHIENMCLEKGIKLIRPPFRRQKKQFTPSEAQTNVFIAKARVHVERVNQRIKLFKILNNTLPWHLINKSEEIFAICCAIVNLSSPLFSWEQ